VLELVVVQSPNAGQLLALGEVGRENILELLLVIRVVAIRGDLVQVFLYELVFRILFKDFLIMAENSFNSLTTWLQVLLVDIDQTCVLRLFPLHVPDSVEVATLPVSSILLWMIN